MPLDLPALLLDLEAETDDLCGLLGGLATQDWERPTPAAGWAVRDQVSHLAFFDEAATTALSDPEAFRRDAAELMAAGMDFPDRVAARHRDLPAADLLAWFTRARAGLLRAFAGAEAGTRLPWFGPDMSAASSLTARLMETWAHGQDVADTLGVTRVPAARLRHVAHLGVATRGFSYSLRGLAAPPTPVRVELSAPDGSTWTWGEPTAPDRVSGSAVDFCLLVTQRRHRDETALRVTGAAATEWLTIAQAYAGASAPGRPEPSALTTTSTPGDT